ncbi:hypothetical protein A6J66_013115 [Yersinia enterocolitica]|nr:hypothetical protein A6J66_013115 [Yersinia enterocolitica]
MLVRSINNETKTSRGRFSRRRTARRNRSVQVVREDFEYCPTPDQPNRSKFFAESKPVEPDPANPGGGI